MCLNVDRRALRFAWEESNSSIPRLTPRSQHGTPMKGRRLIVVPGLHLCCQVKANGDGAKVLRDTWGATTHFISAPSTTQDPRLEHAKYPTLT